MEYSEDIDEIGHDDCVPIDEHKELHEANAALHRRVEKLEGALSRMPCSEAMGCDEPVMEGSRHDKRCSLRIAKEALASNG